MKEKKNKNKWQWMIKKTSHMLQKGQWRRGNKRPRDVLNKKYRCR